MPGATVTLLNTGTGFSRTVVTDAHGEYTAPSIPTGTYTVTAEITGFKKVSKTNVLVGVDQKVRIDVALELGAMDGSSRDPGRDAAAPVGVLRPGHRPSSRSRSRRCRSTAGTS